MFVIYVCVPRRFGEKCLWFDEIRAICSEILSVLTKLRRKHAYVLICLSYMSVYLGDLAKNVYVLMKLRRFGEKMCIF